MATTLPSRPPSAARGTGLGRAEPYLAQDCFRSHSPVEMWRALRTNSVFQAATDANVRDLIASTWRQNTAPQALKTGAQLYAANCAACHGEGDDGMGV